MSKQVMQRALSALEDAGTLNTYDWHPASIFKRFYASTTGDYVDLRQLREKTAPAIAELRAEIANPVEPVAFLADATRFKVRGDEDSEACRIYGIPHELNGRWVALVAADDNCHLKLTAPPDTEAMRKELERVKAAFGNEQLARFIEKHGDPVPIVQELERVKGERDAMCKALNAINKLDPLDTDEGFNEWGEAICFRSAQAIAASAIAEQGNPT